MLGKDCWTQNGTDGTLCIYCDRVGFDQAFFDVYGNGWGQDWGNAEIAFTQWLIRTNRILYSAYWSFVDAGLITDMFLAALIFQHGGRQSGNGLVQNWLNFMMSPNLYTFWEAHNDSIFGYTFSAQGLADFHAESHNEQLFINDALFGLAATADYEKAQPQNGGCWPSTNCLKFIANTFYPNYPTPDSWFHTPQGRWLTTAACLHPIFEGVC